VLLAAADDRIARYRHPIPTARPIERRLMLVVVAERWGLHAAITRFAELSEPDAEIVARTEAVARVHEAMVDATRPGATLGDVLGVAQRAYAAEGHPEEWRLHHQGGVIGYAGRERIAVPGDRTAIEHGMAFAWNPSIAGAKAEETILLREDGVRVLTR
jgi:Xaa-Pro aminopeptidase